MVIPFPGTRKARAGTSETWRLDKSPVARCLLGLRDGKTVGERSSSGAPATRDLAGGRSLSETLDGHRSAHRLHRAARPQRPARHRRHLSGGGGRGPGRAPGGAGRAHHQRRHGAAPPGIRRLDHPSARDPHGRGARYGQLPGAPRLRPLLLPQRPRRQHRDAQRRLLRDLCRSEPGDCRAQPAGAALPPMELVAGRQGERAVETPLRCGRRAATRRRPRWR